MGYELPRVHVAWFTQNGQVSRYHLSGRDGQHTLCGKAIPATGAHTFTQTGVPGWDCSNCQRKARARG